MHWAKMKETQTTPTTTSDAARTAQKPHLGVVLGDDPPDEEHEKDLGDAGAHNVERLADLVQLDRHDLLLFAQLRQMLTGAIADLGRRHTHKAAAKIWRVISSVRRHRLSSPGHAQMQQPPSASHPPRRRGGIAADCRFGRLRRETKRRTQFIRREEPHCRDCQTRQRYHAERSTSTRCTRDPSR